MPQSSSMDGVLIRLHEDTRGQPGHWFRIAFKPVISKLDTLRWYAPEQPWMGAPEGFDEPEDLWRRGALQRYGDHFGEEFIELWGYSSTPASFARETSAAVLIYTDSTCWEYYTSLDGTAQAVLNRANDRPEMRAVRASLKSRGQAFGDAGVSDVWRSLQGRA